MSKTVLLLSGLLICVPIIAQNTGNRQGVSDSYQEEAYVPEQSGLARERRFIFGFNLRGGGLTSLGPNSPIYTAGLMSLQVTAAVTMYKNLTLDLHFRTAFPLNGIAEPLNRTLPMVFQSSITAGFYVGLGGRVWDNRVYSQGWVISLSGGFTMDFGLRSLFSAKRAFSSAETLYQMFSLGAELSALFAYYFHPRVAVSLSAYAGVSGAPFAGDPFYVNFNPLQVGFAQLSFGLGVGLLF